MAVKIIVGLQYGDEGKGRATYFEAKNVDIVIRATGGCNAGHTVIVKDKKYQMHLLPSSITRSTVLSMIGPGVVADLKVLLDEVKSMRSEGVLISNKNFVISERTHITLPHHKELDRLYELLKTDKIGTTGRGIGPTEEEKVRRTNIRMHDLFLDDATLRFKIDENLKVYNMLAVAVNEQIDLGIHGKEEKFPNITSLEELVYCRKYGDLLKPFVADTQCIVDDAIEKKKEIIIEGAQSFWLDKDNGDYPMCTPSNPNASGSASGAGIGPTRIDEVIGVMKAYTSRVGNGYFVTEENNEIGDKIRELGHEYGTTTGRPRRCGYLDLVMIASTKHANGLTGLCVNHIDTIGKLDEIKVCYGYEKNREVTHRVPIENCGCKPLYTTFKGGFTTEGATTFEELPEQAQEYIKFIEKYVGIPVKYIGVGASEEKTIIR